MLVLSTAAAAQQGQEGQVDPSLEEAIRWYTGVGGEVDDRRARTLLLEAVADDDPISRMWLARCHSRGRMFFEHDKALTDSIAASVLDRVHALALQDVAEAAFLMGTANDEGLAMEPDPALAAAWFHRAADQAHVLSQHNLGNAYAAGRGLPQSDEMAIFWWRKAAEQGDAIPQLRLGEAYEEGRGVDRDLDMAKLWYGRSAGRGNSTAVEALKRLEAGSGQLL